MNIVLTVCSRFKGTRYSDCHFIQLLRITYTWLRYSNRRINDILFRRKRPRYIHYFMYYLWAGNAHKNSRMYTWQWSSWLMVRLERLLLKNIKSKKTRVNLAFSVYGEKYSGTINSKFGVTHFRLKI